MENSLRRNKNNKKLTITLFVLYVALTIVVYILPYAKYTVPYIVAALMMLITIPFLMFRTERWLMYSVVLCVFSYAIIFIGMVTGVYGLSDGINEFIRNVRFFVPVLWGCYSVQAFTTKHRKIIMAVFGVCVVVVFVKTFEALNFNPLIVRELARNVSSSDEVTNTFRLGNVAGFGFAYMMGIVTVALGWAFGKIHGKKAKILCGLALAVCYYFIIQTMYTTLLLLTTICLLIMVFMNTKSTMGKVALVIAAILILLYMGPVFKFLGGLFPSDSVLSAKFTNMYIAITEDNIEAIGSRPQLLMKAVQNWIENPIFGGEHSESNSHSFLMSIMENSGLVGMSVWLYFFCSSWFMLKRKLVEYKKDVQLLGLSFFYVFALAFVNPIGYVFEVTIAAFFLVPLWICFIEDREEEYALS